MQIDSHEDDTAPMDATPFGATRPSPQVGDQYWLIEPTSPFNGHAPTHITEPWLGQIVTVWQDGHALATRVSTHRPIGTDRHAAAYVPYNALYASQIDAINTYIDALDDAVESERSKLQQMEAKLNSLIKQYRPMDHSTLSGY